MAARSGDPRPRLVQHTRGTREAATTTTGSICFGDEPSYLVAIRGSFTARRHFPPLPPELRDHVDRDKVISYSVKVLVINIDTGEITEIAVAQTNTLTSRRSDRWSPTTERRETEESRIPHKEVR